MMHPHTFRAMNRCGRLVAYPGSVFSAEQRSDPLSQPALMPSTPAVRRRIYQSNEREDRSFEFAELPTAPLIVDAVYLRGSAIGKGADTIAKLLPGAGNSGGFRGIGGLKFGTCKALALVSTGDERDWPDRLDSETGIFTYYGDNRKPGHLLNKTPRGGNLLLEEMFDACRVVQVRRNTPPIFVFVNNGDRAG
ncbi:MAG: hypothetical protein O2800_07720, partial [Planctomycetota bacterium]|nr:hypothetical protein [Planctomycetota bacterium]